MNMAKEVGPVPVQREKTAGSHADSVARPKSPALIGIPVRKEHLRTDHR